MKVSKLIVDYEIALTTYNACCVFSRSATLEEGSSNLRIRRFLERSTHNGQDIPT